MEGFVHELVLHISVLIEAAAALLVAIAVARATWLTVFSAWRSDAGPLSVRLTLGRWLTLSLEFLVAADILRTAVAPTWTEIGQLGAVVVLRTVLNFFLEREIRAGLDHHDQRPAQTLTGRADQSDTPASAPGRTSVPVQSSARASSAEVPV